jgi:hypothetical protein
VFFNKKTEKEEELLLLLAKTKMERLHGMQSLFVEHDNLVVDNFVRALKMTIYK